MFSATVFYKTCENNVILGFWGFEKKKRKEWSRPAALRPHLIKAQSLLLDVFLMVWMCNNNAFMICNKSSKFILYETRNFLIYLFFMGGGLVIITVTCFLPGGPIFKNVWHLKLFLLMSLFGCLSSTEWCVCRVWRKLSNFLCWTFCVWELLLQTHM